MPAFLNTSIMKQILLTILCLWGIAYGQTTGYFRYDSIKFEKSGGNSEFILLNGTRAVTGGVLTNTGNGRTAFVTPSVGPVTGLLTEYMGKAYTDSTWANLSDFTNDGATVAASGGELVFTGGSNTFTESLNINVNQDKSITPYYTNLERWRFVHRFRIVTNGVVAIGTRGATNIIAYINTTTGASWFNEFATSNLSSSVGDTIEIIAERDGFNTMIQVRNVTTNSATITTYSSYTIAGATLPTTGQFAIFNYSGNFNTVYLKVDSYTPLYADLIIIGDSKTQGYRASYLQRYPTILGDYYNVIAHAGQGETSATWELSWNEVTALEGKNIILTNPSNDLRTGVNTDSTKARYYRLENALRTAGANVWHANGYYENGFNNPTAWVAYIASSRDADSIIDTYTPTSTTAGYLDADNVHPSPFGMTVIANAILTSNKIRATIIPALAPARSIQNQTEAQQRAGFNIGGIPSTLASTLSIGNGTAADLQLHAHTGSNTNINLFSSGGYNYIESQNDARSGPIRLKTSSYDLGINTNIGEAALFSELGAVKFSEYGGGAFTGTPTYSLQVDASGNVIEGAVGASSVPISGLTAATAMNSINNADYVQGWQWSTLSGTALDLASGSTAATGNQQVLLALSLGGANANSTQTTRTLSLSNAHTGTSSTNIGAEFSASAGTNNYAIIVPSSGGSVGIGTSAPTELLHVVGGSIMGRWKARVGSTASSATPTINTDNVDIYKLTAQAADITSFTSNLSGTPVDGDILEIQITGTAARAIAWGASFVSSTVTLPATTVTTATLTVILQYYTTSSYGNNKWVCTNYY